ncbi:Myb/SANT-like DNA-binding domain-containing protein [Melampsora americana]|nr:Myb/SANT-like DNA-binding domain-containing protein [Melampsora americana]
MGKEAEKSPAHFSNGRSDFILQSLLEQANDGLRVENVFKKEAWVTVAKAFNKLYHEDYEITALKNHYNSQRTLYKTFDALKNYTGAGWDDEKKMVIASDEWWKIKIAVSVSFPTTMIMLINILI